MNEITTKETAVKPYKAIVWTTQAGRFLRGGVKVVSARFNSSKEAQDWLQAMRENYPSDMQIQTRWTRS